MEKEAVLEENEVSRICFWENPVCLFWATFLVLERNREVFSPQDFFLLQRMAILSDV